MLFALVVVRHRRSVIDADIERLAEREASRNGFIDGALGHVLAVYVQLSRTLEHSGFDEVEFQVHLAGRQDRRHNGIADPGSRGLRLRLRCGSPS